MGLANFVCDELHWAIRETLRASGADELSLMGWVHRRATLCAMYCGLDGISRGGRTPGRRRPAMETQGSAWPRGGPQPGAADDARRCPVVDLRGLGRGSASSMVDEVASRTGA